jgi:hypothetical protein
MRTVGSLFFLAGIALGIYAFLEETSVPADDSFLSVERISNLSLMNQKQSLLIIAGVLSLMGSIFIGSDHIAQSVNNLKMLQQKAEPLNSLISHPDIPPNVTQIHLQEQYNKGEITFEEFNSKWNNAKS